MTNPREAINLRRMRSLSDQFFLMLPALLVLLLMALFAAPLYTGGWSLAPNVAWLATLVLGVAYPAGWPRWMAFLAGLAQDVMFATPLGSQALLTLLLAQLVDAQARRQAGQPFLIRWMEAAGALLVLHALLWALFSFVTPDAPALRSMLRATIASVLWYPVFFALFTRLADVLHR